MNIFDVTKGLILENKKVYIGIIIFSILLSIALLYSFYNDPGKGFSVTMNLAEKGISIFIFLPSLTFVVFGLFPAFSKERKLELMSLSVEGGNSLQVQIFLNQFVFILYWSLILIIFSFGYYLLVQLNISLNGLSIFQRILQVTVPGFFLFMYSLLLGAIFYELYRCIELIYNLILGDYASVYEKENS